MRSNNKPPNNMLMNYMALAVDVFSALMEGWVVCEKNSNLVITIHWHTTMYLKTKLSK